MALYLPSLDDEELLRFAQPTTLLETELLRRFEEADIKSDNETDLLGVLSDHGCDDATDLEKRLTVMGTFDVTDMEQLVERLNEECLTPPDITEILDAMSEHGVQTVAELARLVAVAVQLEDIL